MKQYIEVPYMHAESNAQFKEFDALTFQGKLLKYFMMPDISKYDYALVDNYSQVEIWLRVTYFKLEDNKFKRKYSYKMICSVSKNRGNKLSTFNIPLYRIPLYRAFLVVKFLYPCSRDVYDNKNYKIQIKRILKHAGLL